jgi:hypothetical protein
MLTDNGPGTATGVSVNHAARRAHVHLLDPPARAPTPQPAAFGRSGQARRFTPGGRLLPSHGPAPGVPEQGLRQ